MPEVIQNQDQQSQNNFVPPKQKIYKRNVSFFRSFLIIIIVAFILTAICLAGIRNYRILSENIINPAITLAKTPNLMNSLTPPALSYDKALLKNINQNFTGNSEYSLDINNPIYSLAISADFSLPNNNSLVRVVLTDTNNNEYLVYEAYAAISDANNSITNACEETCVLNAIIPSVMKIQIENASIRLKSVYVFTSVNDLKSDVKQIGVEEYKKELKKQQDQYKIGNINKNIKAKDKKWIAGETTVSQMAYAEKKKLFTSELDFLPNLQGFEYYKAGYFEITTVPDVMVSAPSGSKPTKPTATSTPPAPPTNDLVSYPTDTTTIKAPAAWDWRSVNGENWVTAVTNQGNCGSCWDFAATGAIETVVNLFFNQHLNFNLSEQDVLSCSNTGTCKGGNASGAMNYISSTGIVNETCMPYKAVDANGCNYSACTYTAVPCSSKCTTPTQIVKASGYSGVASTENDVKNAIVQNGALAGSISQWWHLMAIVGYGTVKAGDKIFDASTQDVYASPFIVASTSSDVGRTFWIYKNSWGTGWGESGFGKIIFSSGNAPTSYAYKLPINVTSATQYSIACTDKDADGFCSWGLSTSKPSSCPLICDANNQKDCDDSNATIGACNFQPVTKEYVSICREYLPTAECGYITSCPSGYSRTTSNLVCARSKNTKTYWTFCARNFNYCGRCPSGTVLFSYSYCSGTQICNTALNQCSPAQ